MVGLTEYILEINSETKHLHLDFCLLRTHRRKNQDQDFVISDVRFICAISDVTVGFAEGLLLDRLEFAQELESCHTPIRQLVVT